MVTKWVRLILIFVGLFYVSTLMVLPSTYYKSYITAEEENPDQESKDEFFKKELIVKDVDEYYLSSYVKQITPLYIPHTMSCLLGYCRELFLPPEYHVACFNSCTVYRLALNYSIIPFKHSYYGFIIKV